MTKNYYHFALFEICDHPSLTQPVKTLGGVKKSAPGMGGGTLPLSPFYQFDFHYKK